MLSLLWFSGINFDTPIGDIGWTYVVLLLLIVFVIYMCIKLVREFREEW